MDLPRVQLFELNDSPWAPKLLRDTVVQALSRSLAWGRVLEGVVEPFARFLEQSGTTEVLDCCAGAGEPAAIFVDELQRSGRVPPKFLLTDLFPHVSQWERLRDRHPGVIDFVAEPVDATRIPAHVGRGSTRLIMNALHHFPPALAREVLLGACAQAPGVFVVEGFASRNPLRFAAFAPAGLAALFAAPVISEDRRLERALISWLTPAALLASIWDGSVSTLRTYSEADLRELVAPLGDAWRWEYGVYEYGGIGRGSWFSGIAR